MSRAFVKEVDDDPPADAVPERPQSPHPNYVTARGLSLLHAKVHGLVQARDRLVGQDDPLARVQLLQVKRDLRYFQGRLELAILVDPRQQPEDEVRFGARVELVDAAGGHRAYRIVGEDEADVHEGSISWASPLGKALIGLRVGDTFVWRLGETPRELEVVGIHHPDR